MTGATEGKRMAEQATIVVEMINRFASGIEAVREENQRYVHSCCLSCTLFRGISSAD